MRLTTSVCLLILLCQWPGVHAAVLQGTVVGITDGDTLTLLDVQHQQHKIRLAGIDAPEIRQDHGQRAKQHLSSLVFGQQVDVHWQKKDRYRRIVGKVMAAPPECTAGQATTCPRTQDICHAMLNAGMAWWYRKYAAEQSEADAKRYELAEKQARQRMTGLWSLAAPTPPWEWRQQSRVAD